MKLSQPARLLLLLLPVTGCVTQQIATNLLPGLTYYDGKENLEGKLVFVASRNLLFPTNKTEAAVICEFDLREKKLRQLSESASGGQFIVSDQGNAYAVTCPEERPQWGQMMKWPPDRQPTLAFLYCQDVQQSKTVRLSSPPKVTAIVGRHFFFQLAVFKTAAPYEVACDERILHVDFNKGTQEFLELPGASRWETEMFDFMHTHDGNTNEVHFLYNHHGTRLAEGRDYPQAVVYAFNAQTGSIQPAPKGDWNVISEFKTFDGQFVWFAGYNTPISGNKLMKSPWDNERWQLLKDPKSKSAKLLKRFSNLRGNVFRLSGMSPCRHYALVWEDAQELGKSPINTYYMVDVVNGNTRVLLKDEVARKATGSISPVYWVGGRK